MEPGLLSQRKRTMASTATYAKNSSSYILPPTSIRLRFAGLLTEGGIIIFSCCRPTETSVDDDVRLLCLESGSGSSAI